MESPLDIAIVGIGGIFPGADTLENFWQTIKNGISQNSIVPNGRWIADPCELLSQGENKTDKSISEKGCFIKNYPFDKIKAGQLSDDLIKELDPLVHLTLLAGQAAFEDCKTDNVSPEKTGVILGSIALPTEKSSELSWEIMGSLIENKLKGKTDIIQKTNPLNAFVNSIPAFILAETLGITGTCFTLDAACASSLYAIKLACDKLIAGTADLMLTGGVSRPDCLYTAMGFTQLSALSPDGICAPFDKKGKGLVIGEGAGIVALKRLSDAQEAGDKIYGVIKGIGLSNDTEGKLLAPSSEGQLRAVKKAYTQAKWSPWDVDLFECHATGTPVGDRIEFDTLMTLHDEYEKKERNFKSVLSSTKSNIGHLLTGAGGAGLIKVLLCMQNETLPPIANYSDPSVPISESPFEILQESKSWGNRYKKAAVSAFGFGGINAHLLVETYDPDNFTENSTDSKHSSGTGHFKHYDIAITGIGLNLGNCETIEDFKSILTGESKPKKQSKTGKFSLDEVKSLFRINEDGFYTEDLTVPYGTYKIPPTELSESLPQQVLMLESARKAIENSSIKPEELKKCGVFIGINFDFATTDYFVRWKLGEENLKDLFSPALNANRVMGSLGNIVASRIAREFKIGGPSFTVSSEENSSFNALDIALNMLRNGEIDVAIVGSSDVSSDIRYRISCLNSENKSIPNGEGSVAFVLKRKTDAIKDKNKIYAVINNLNTTIENFDYNEYSYPQKVVSDKTFQGSLGANTAFFGASSFASSLLKLALMLKNKIIPQENGNTSYQHWLRNRADSIRTASIKTKNMFGHIGNVTVTEFDPYSAKNKIITNEKLFLFTSDTKDNLLEKIKTFAKSIKNTDASFEEFALDHFQETDLNGPCRLAVTADSKQTLSTSIKKILEQGINSSFAKDGIFFTKNPIGNKEKIAFVFPGSGNHYAKMGLGYASNFPEVINNQDKENLYLKDQIMPWNFWNKNDISALNENHPALLQGQVAMCSIVSDVIQSLKIKPSASIGYSLGEMASVVSLRIWDSRDEMLKNMNSSDLFKTELANPYTSAKKAWNLKDDDIVDWSIGVINADPEKVKEKIVGREHVYLLIINTQYDCVIGGDRKEVLKLANDLDSILLPVEGVTTVHCEVLKPVSQRYRDFHFFKAENPDNITFYSTGWGKNFEPTSANIADSILAQASDTVDFPTVINRAWEDGIRVFIETGPDNSCTRMISTILRGKEHLAVNTTKAGKSEMSSLLNLCAVLFANGIEFDLTPFYNFEVKKDKSIEGQKLPLGYSIIDFTNAIDEYKKAIAIEEENKAASTPLTQTMPEQSATIPTQSTTMPTQSTTMPTQSTTIPTQSTTIPTQSTIMPTQSTIMPTQSTTIPIQSTTIPTQSTTIPTQSTTIPIQSVAIQTQSNDSYKNTIPDIKINKTLSPAIINVDSGLILNTILAGQKSILDAHQSYLQFSDKALEAVLAYIKKQNTEAPARKQIEKFPISNEIKEISHTTDITNNNVLHISTPGLFMTREDCMEFAVGAISKVLGKEFEKIDSHPTRVRLPDEPLMLVDRIISVEGETRSMTTGGVVTEHDIKQNAWYLDNGRIPTCIAVEAGQADLFLSGYLGIDFITEGNAVYRLLDASIIFHDSLPASENTIHYDIKIEKFFTQGSTWLFNFHFDGTVNGKPLLSMRNGCAGFFTQKELDDGKGIIHTALDLKPMEGKLTGGFQYPIEIKNESYSDAQLNALRKGNLAECFGNDFTNLDIKNPLVLPSEPKMKLVDRILSIEPQGGRYSLGKIKGQADIHKEDWFLTCHFSDDNVMPGTLMYECCMHTLRIFLMRMGWVDTVDSCVWEPIPEVRSSLKCRGQVTEKTRTAEYEISIKELGYNPYPYAIADALMYADGRPVVEMLNMSIQLSGSSKDKIEKLWESNNIKIKEAIFDNKSILAFAEGNPSEAFGKPYQIFDKERRIARLPRPPYKFLDRITEVNAPQWEMKSSGEIEAQYDITGNEWYFADEKTGNMPFAVLLEVALQPCGWLAAYAGSALTYDTDLSFRNLGGTGTLYRQVKPESALLNTRVRMTNVSTNAGMIIQHYDFSVADPKGLIYKGNTYFGFFSKDALAHQIGIRDIKIPSIGSCKNGKTDITYPQNDILPQGMIKMIDSIDLFLPEGGTEGLGYIAGSMKVRSSDWFFNAHFYQDPVIPGSLGLESMIQLMKYMAGYFWDNDRKEQKCYNVQTPNLKHTWIYRGQVIPSDSLVIIQVWVKKRDDISKTLTCEGILSVDGRNIYQMNDFSVSLQNGILL